MNIEKTLSKINLTAGSVSDEPTELAESTNSTEPTESITSANDDPKDWSARKKFLILIIISFASMISPMTST
jgi:hypothetical protein